MARSGYVLAGGRSRRMGRDKARLPFRGGILAEAVTEAVREAAGSATIVGHPELGGIPDLHPGEGPLGGILTALSHSTCDWNLIVACDMPELTASFLRGLMDSAESVGCAVLVPYSTGGRPQPLCAVYRRYVREHLCHRFEAGERKIVAALEGLAVARLDVPEDLSFQNVNTPEEWAIYAAD